jgi:hypothetical protein
MHHHPQRLLPTTIMDLLAHHQPRSKTIYIKLYSSSIENNMYHTTSPPQVSRIMNYQCTMHYLLMLLTWVESAIHISRLAIINNEIKMYGAQAIFS